MLQSDSRTWRVWMVAALAMLFTPYVSVLRAEQTPVIPAPPGPISIELIRALPGLAWPILVLLLLIFYGRSVARLVTGLVWRVRAGASIRIGSFQLEQLDVAVTRQGQVPPSGTVKAEDDPGVFAISRREVLENSRGIFLAHQITPSRNNVKYIDDAADVRLFVALPDDKITEFEDEISCMGIEVSPEPAPENLLWYRACQGR